MKKIVVWLSASSRVSWLQVWKQMHVWHSLPISTCWWWEVTSARGRERKVPKEQLLFWGGKKVHGCVSQNSDPMNSVLRKAGEFGLNASTGHTMKFWRCTWYKITIRESKRTIWRHYPKRWTSWAKSLRAQFWDEILEETSRQADCDSKSSVELGKKSTMRSKSDLSSDKMDSLRRSRNPTTVLSRDCKSAKKRGRTSFCSWFRSVRNCAITRWNASGSVAWYALLKTEIFITMEKR